MASILRIAFLVVVGVTCLSALPANHPAKTVKISSQVVEEDPAYIYNSVLVSYLEYQAAKEAAELEAELGIRGSNSDTHICYDNYGCFFKNGTFGNFWRLPVAPETTGTVFYLWTSATQEDPEVIDYKSTAWLNSTSFRADRPTVMIIHGFGSGVRAPWAEPLRQAVYRGQPESNYIFVDWGRSSKAPDYWGASANIQIIAVQIAKLITVLNTNLGSNSSSFHLIGHSLGAHLAGFTAHRLKELGQPKVGKITGLDAAGPIFEGGHSDAILSIGDADFVQGIHGNGAGMLAGGLGLFARVGDIDFYPNGGQYQPGCKHMIWGTIGSALSFDWGNVPESAKCNHNRAIEFAIDSVDNSCLHTSYACDNYTDFKEGKCFGGEKAIMGLFVENKPAAKEHYLITHAASSYCAHATKISLKISATSEKKSSGSLFVTLVGKNGVEETVTQMAEKEALPPSKLVVEIIASKLKVSELTAIKIRYEPECGWVFCSPERITADWVEVDSLEADGNQLCGRFEVLYKRDTVTFPLSSCKLSRDLLV